MLNVAIDINPMHHYRTGIGNFVHRLLHDLDQDDRIHPIPIIQSIKPVGNYHPNQRRIFFPGKFLPIIRPFSARQIHIYHGTNFIIPRWLGDGRKIKKVVTIHDLAFLKPEFQALGVVHKTFEQFLPYSLQTADWVTCVSQTTRTDLLKFFPFVENKSSVIPLLPTSPFLQFLTKPIDVQLFKDKPYFLFLSSINPRKNLPFLLSVWEKLPASFRESFDLLIVGQPEMKLPTLSEQIQSSIRFTGYLTDEQVWNLMSHTQALVSPSLDEGFGYPLLEARLLGTPIVASDISAYRENFAKDADLLALDELIWVERLQEKFHRKEKIKLEQLEKLWSDRRYGDVYEQLG